MLIRPFRIGKASYAGRVTRGERDVLRRRCVGGRAYMNVKISLKLSRTSSAPWEAAVE